MRNWRPNTRITLQYSTRVSDGGGGYQTTWNDDATVPSEKATHRSNEAVQAMATTGFAVHNHRIRYRRNIRSSWRIKEGNSYQNIIGPPVLVEGKKRFLDITAKEATA